LIREVYLILTLFSKQKLNSAGCTYLILINLIDLQRERERDIGMRDDKMNGGALFIEVMRRRNQLYMD
jgi:hypothetical protein